MLTQMPYDTDLFESFEILTFYDILSLRLGEFLFSYKISRLKFNGLFLLRTRNTCTRNTPSICIIRYRTELSVCYQGPSGFIIRLMLILLPDSFFCFFKNNVVGFYFKVVIKSPEIIFYHVYVFLFFEISHRAI